MALPKEKTQSGDKNQPAELIAQLLTEAEQLHRASDLFNAAHLYSRVIRQEPDNWIALLGLGVVKHALGDTALAEDLLGEAISYRPDQPEIHVNLGIAQLQNGRIFEAAASAERALQLDRLAPTAHRVLGLARRFQGDRSGAILGFTRELMRDPAQIEALGDLATDLGDENEQTDTNPKAASIRFAARAATVAPLRRETHYAHARALQVAGQVSQAADTYARSLVIDPSFGSAYLAMGLALAAYAGDHAAIETYLRAVRLDPMLRQASFTLGKALMDLERLDEAAEVLSEILLHDPRFPEGHNLMAAILREQGKIAKSVDHLRLAIRLKPDMGPAYANMAMGLANLGRRREGIAALRAGLSCEPLSARMRGDLAALLHQEGEINESFQQHVITLAIDPASAAALGNFGNILRDLNILERAHQVLVYATLIDPNMVSNWNNLGLMKVSRRESPAAFDAFARAMAIVPESEAAYNGMAGLAKDLGELSLAARIYDRMVRLNPNNSALHSNLLFLLNYQEGRDPEQIAQAHKAWGQQFAQSDAIAPACTNPAGRKLRVGYVSADFRQHVVSHFTWPLFDNHDQGRVEIYCYDNTFVPDTVSEKLSARADHWRRIVAISDEDCAIKIRNDQIDVLVDLSGHTGGNRLTLFAHRPAPVQISALGYPNTTGLAAMDYRLSDQWADPQGLTDGFHTEEIVRLAGGFNCYRPPDDGPDPSPSPAQENGFVTFGCFNNFTKVSGATLRAWSRILMGIPGSKLILKSVIMDDPIMQERVHREFALLGIDPARIDCRGWVAQGHYLDSYADIDIALDPFPYNGTTTTCDALWMGVPCVVLAGSFHAARVGESLLSRLGHPEWVGREVDDYVAIAITLASDINQLVIARQAQRDRMEKSSLRDEKGYTRAVEDLFFNLYAKRFAEQQAHQANNPKIIPAKSAEMIDLEQRIAALPFWYHRIALPHGIVTPGWAPLSVEAYGIPDRLDGLRVLDIGAWDGFWSFEALKRGAREVVAIDDFSDFLGGLQDKDRRAWENFDLCRAALGYDPAICQRIEMSVYDITPERLGLFDVVFFFGTIYHLRHPMLAFDRLAAITTGSIHVESAILDLASGYRGIGHGYPGNQVVAEFYPGREYGNNDTNWWTPSLRCLGAWMEAAGFIEVEGWLLTERALDLANARGFARGIKPPK